MPNEKSNANIGFEKEIWDAACVLWGHIPAADYRKVIVGLIFLRYVSCAFDKRHNVLVEEGDGFEDDKDAYTAENVFYVPETARWSVIASAAHTPEIGKVIDEAMKAIEVENPALKNVLPKNYNNPDLDKRVLGEVVDLFTNNIRMDDVDQGRDLLGRTYEYCIAQFAAYEGVKGGEFYTPSSIVKTIVAIRQRGIPITMRILRQQLSRQRRSLLVSPGSMPTRRMSLCMSGARMQGSSAISPVSWCTTARIRASGICEMSAGRPMTLPTLYRT